MKSSWREHLIEGITPFRLEKYLNEAWRAYTSHFIVFAISSAIAVALTILSLSVLSGLLTAGYIMLFVRLFREDKAPEIDHLFQHPDKLLLLWGAWILIALAISVGLFLLILPGVLVTALSLYIFPLLVDQKMPLDKAIRKSIDLAWHQSGLLKSALLALVIIVVNFIGYKIFYVGLIFTLPLTTGIVAAAYCDLIGAEEQASETREPLTKP